MPGIKDKEKDALLRMMVYLKYELLRNNLKNEANLLSKVIESFRNRLEKADED